MAIHVITTPEVISRKNAKRYLSEHLTLPSTVKKIEEDAFARQAKIESIQFPESLLHISARAFMDCIHLKELDLPDTLQQFDKECFSGCKALSYVKLSKSLKNIPDRAFYRCRNLSEIEIPEGIQKIGEEAFYFANIEKLQIPSTVTAIKSKAFFRCNRLTSVIIPSNVMRIEDEAFHGCNYLKILEIAYEPKYIGERIVNRSSTIRCYKDSKVDRYCQEYEIPTEYIQ